MATDYIWQDGFAADVHFGFVDESTPARQIYAPRLVTNTDSNTMLRALREELKSAREFFFSVAFVTPRAIALLIQELADFVGTGTIVTSDYLGFNAPAGFRELLRLKRFGITTLIHSSPAFHPKGYIFQQADAVTTILGSSNLTASALVTNHEWNLRVAARSESNFATQLSHVIAAQRSDAVPLTEEWIDQYEANYLAPPRRTITRAPNGSEVRLPSPDRAMSTIVPNGMQLEALAALEKSRLAGRDKAMVISATGTGKTILAALDVRATDPDRFLFVVHREQILDKAIEEFQRVIGAPREEFGKVSGARRELDRRYVFATLQTISQADVLEAIDPNAFEYVLIDEAHRSGAASYARLLEHLRPTFLLGMTATPERPDGFDVFGLFDYNVAYEIRLERALQADMLVPFHYFGVADYTTDDGTTTDERSGLGRLLAHSRVQHVLDALGTYGHVGIPVRGLIFCRSREEAAGLAAALNDSHVNGKQLRTVALSGADSVAQREQAVEDLERGRLDYLITVDIFNEGIDIPSVNQIVMLRQTQSAIVFVQQLGRGLRKAPDKDHIRVIDFIGNYANNFMIPIALFGDQSLNKESLRKNLIAAEEIGVSAGLSSIRFDRIAQERVLRSISSTKLDSLANLRQAVEGMRNRLGRVPRLQDFDRFDAADPLALATAAGNYSRLLERLLAIRFGFTSAEHAALSLIAQEVLSSKRSAEAHLLTWLLTEPARSRTALADALSARVGGSSTVDVDSALRVLDLSFFTDGERDRYQLPLVTTDGTDVHLAPLFAHSYRSTPGFADAVDDLLATALSITERRYAAGRPFVPAKQYSRKDACRLLGWQKNVASTIYGYRVDQATKTCPMFITLHKGDEVGASTSYGDELLDTSTMRWFSRNRRTLKSGEVAAVVSNEVQLHVFVKKDDAEGSDFYYLGRATAREARETTMPNGDRPLPVVEVMLHFDQPIDAALFDYFQPVLTV